MGCCVCFTPEGCDGKSGILAHNRYCGAKRQLTTPDKWVITKSTHEGILTGEEFIRIQGIVAEKSYDMTNGKKAAHRVSHNSRNLLSGTLYSLAERICAQRHIPPEICITSAKASWTQKKQNAR